ncbi:MAG: CarD family transcriptional regulator, partial [Actinomycetota bacterium]
MASAGPQDRAGSVVTVPDAARPYLLAAFVRHLDRPVLAVAARGEDAEQLARDVQAFLGREGADVFPGWEVLPGEPVSPSVETMGRRLQVLHKLAAGKAFVVATSAQGATQLVAPLRGDAANLILKTGAELDLEEAAARLVEMGYERNYIVERRGEFAIRGGILDVFAPAAERPVRAEFWGDEITSVRQFALASQRSLDEVESADIAPCRELIADEATTARAAELARVDHDPVLAQLAEGIIEQGAERLLPRLTGGLVTLGSFFPDGSPAVVLEPKRVHDRGSEIIEQVDEWTRSNQIADRHYAPLDETLQGFGNVVLMSTFSADTDGAGGGPTLDIDTWTQAVGKPELVVQRLQSLIKNGYRAVVAASLPDTAERMRANFAQSGLDFELATVAPDAQTPPGGKIVLAELNRGFVLPWARLALVAESDLTGRRSGAARRRQQARRRQISGPLELAEGDLVVHEVHGIGRYVGMVDRDLLGVHREYLVLEYSKGDKLYVPSDQIDLVSKYIGGEAPKINRLGSSDWGKTKARVRRRAREIAQELVVLYAKRQA